MSASRKFDEETRARAVRLDTDRLRDHDESKLAARKHVALLDNGSSAQVQIAGSTVGEQMGSRVMR